MAHSKPVADIFGTDIDTEILAKDIVDLQYKYNVVGLTEEQIITVLQYQNDGFTTAMAINIIKKKWSDSKIQSMKKLIQMKKCDTYTIAMIFEHFTEMQINNMIKIVVDCSNYCVCGHNDTYTIFKLVSKYGSTLISDYVYQNFTEKIKDGMSIINTVETYF